MNRHGFTLVELLVVIFIIGVLIALLLPAVQAASEGGRRTQCKNHVHQLALGVQLHHDAFGRFPSDGWGWKWVGDPDLHSGPSQPGGWRYQILPYTEEQALYGLPADGDRDQITPKQRDGATQMVQSPLAWLHCPSRRQPILYRNTSINPYNVHFVPEVANSDYMANWGDTKNYFDEGPTTLQDGLAGRGFLVHVNLRQISLDHLITRPTGIVHPRSQIRIDDVKDGTTKTYLVGECALPWKSDNPGDYYIGPSASVFAHGWTASAYLAPVRDSEAYTLNWPDLNMAYGAFHSTGWHVAMADGSVHTMDYDVDLIVHRAHANRADGGRPNRALP